MMGVDAGNVGRGVGSTGVGGSSVVGAGEGDTVGEGTTVGEGVWVGLDVGGAEGVTGDEGIVRQAENNKRSIVKTVIRTSNLSLNISLFSLGLKDRNEELLKIFILGIETSCCNYPSKHGYVYPFLNWLLCCS